MPPNEKMAEVRVNQLAANGVSLILTILLCLGAVALARRLPHHLPSTPWDVFGLVVSSILLIPIHEGLHGIALILFGKLSRNQLRFGVMWRALMPYCHCTVPIGIKVYRLMALFPLYVTGGLTSISVFVFPSDWLGILTGITLAACVGDVWIVVRLRKFPHDALVQDHPSEIGCDVFSK